MATATIDRLLRANRTIMLVPMVDGPTAPLLVGADGTTTPFASPAATTLNTWAGVVTTVATGASNGGNISCALLDSITLGLAASGQDTTLTVCSIGNESIPTFYNVNCTLTILRDKNKSDTGVFNLATMLLCSADTRYAIVDRVGKPSTAAFATGDIVSIYEIRTDNPIEVKADQANLQLQQVPDTTGLVNVNFAAL